MSFGVFASLARDFQIVLSVILNKFLIQVKVMTQVFTCKLIQMLEMKNTYVCHTVMEIFRKLNVHYVGQEVPRCSFTEDIVFPKWLAILVPHTQ